MTTASGLLRGSEPLRDVQHRSAAKKDGDDSDKDSPLGGDQGDDDSTDADKADSDLTDKGDGGDDSADSDGKD
jgi:hypothetical protein